MNKLFALALALLMIAGLSAFAAAHVSESVQTNNNQEWKSMGMHGMMSRLSEMNEETKDMAIEEMNKMHENMERYMKGELTDEEFEALREQHHERMEEILGEEMECGCGMMNNHGRNYHGGGMGMHKIHNGMG